MARPAMRRMTRSMDPTLAFMGRARSGVVVAEKRKSARMGARRWRLGHGPAGVEPVVQASGVGGADALGNKDACGEAGATAGGAVEKNLATVGFGEKWFPLRAGAGEVAERKQFRGLRDPGDPFAGLADVDEE